jgi:transcriptional regulator with XRE-family HTH domain
MSNYDPQYQIAYNGLLQPAFRAHLDEVRRQRKLTLAQLGDALGISGAFIGNLINGKKAIRTKHIPGIARAVNELENGDRVGSTAHEAPAAPSSEGKLLEKASLEDLARRANALGFNVSFTQIC